MEKKDLSKLAATIGSNSLVWVGNGIVWIITIIIVIIALIAGFWIIAAVLILVGETWNAHKSIIKAILIVTGVIAFIVLSLWGIVKTAMWLSKKQTADKRALIDKVREREKELFETINSNTSTLLEEKLS